MDFLISADIGGFSIEAMWGSMGWFAKGVVIVLLLMSLGSVTVFVERLIVFYGSIRKTRMAAPGLEKALVDGKWTEAQATCNVCSASHLSRVVGAGVADILRTQDLPPVEQAEAARRAMDRMRDRETARLRRGLALLATSGSTAPFIGLLGTVAGIINAFRAIALTGSGGLASVSSGIAEALVTTAIGLLVAIPAVMAFNYLNSIVERLSLDMTDATTEFYDLVVKLGMRGAGASQPKAAQR